MIAAYLNACRATEQLSYTVSHLVFFIAFSSFAELFIDTNERKSSAQKDNNNTAHTQKSTIEPEITVAKG